MGCILCLAASTLLKMTDWKMKSPRMTSPIMKKTTSLMMKMLMKTFQVKCLILMVKMLIFLGIESILNSPHDDYGEFYTDEENYMFTRELVVDPFLNIFMACGREKE
jgi:hypothetical protein